MRAFPSPPGIVEKPRLEQLAVSTCGDIVVSLECWRRMTRRPGSCRGEESRSRQQLHMAPGRGGGGEIGEEEGYDNETEGFRWKALSFFSLSWTETASVAEDFGEGLEGT